MLATLKSISRSSGGNLRPQRITNTVRQDNDNTKILKFFDIVTPCNTFKNKFNNVSICNNITNIK